MKKLIAIALVLGFAASANSQTQNDDARRALEEAKKANAEVQKMREEMEKERQRQAQRNQLDQVMQGQKENKKLNGW